MFRNYFIKEKRPQCRSGSVVNTHQRQLRFRWGPLDGKVPGRKTSSRKEITAKPELTGFLLEAGQGHGIFKGGRIHSK